MDNPENSRYQDNNFFILTITINSSVAIVATVQILSYTENYIWNSTTRLNLKNFLYIHFVSHQTSMILPSLTVH